jgi:hypothetical protein
MQIKFYTLTALLFLLVLPILGAPVPIPFSPAYPSISRRNFDYAEGTIVQLEPNIESVYAHPIKVTFGSLAPLPGRGAVYHVSTTDVFIDSTVRLVAMSRTSLVERSHLRAMKLVVFEGADQKGDQWFIIHEPQGWDINQLFALEDADLKNIVKDSSSGNLVNSLSLWKIGGMKLQPKHVKSLQVDRDMIEGRIEAALREAAGLERLRLVEDFNLLQVQPRPLGMNGRGPRLMNSLNQYRFEVKNGLIQSAHLTNWMFLIDVDGKSLTQEQKDGIVQFKYMNGMKGELAMEDGLSMIFDSRKRKRYR